LHYYHGVLPFVYTKIGQNSKSGVLQCTYTYTVDPHLALAGVQNVNKRWTKARIRNKPGTNRCIFFFDIKIYTVKHCIYYIKLQMSCQYSENMWKK